MPIATRLLTLVAASFLACSAASSEPNASPPSTAAPSDAGRAPVQILVEAVFVKVDPERFRAAVDPSRAQGDLESVLFESAGMEVVSATHVLATDGDPSSIVVGDGTRPDAGAFTSGPSRIDVLAQLRAGDMIHCDVGVFGWPEDAHMTVDVGNGQWIVVGAPSRARDAATDKKVLVAFKSTIIRSREDLERILREKKERLERRRSSGG
jgi:hypothetical protein